ncbi:MAG: carbohydrate ABC transporter permease [Defluviitaleaceae bacterium]|nr:carbohydrate ABC transporter permease [Defluviitaleaceae bacterium]MCL2238509.1 carbohydrate ABC transporter permease [Defluviitaleaceae bacterium]
MIIGSRTREKIRYPILYHFFIGVFGFIMIYPVLWMISGAFKTDVEIASGALTLLPQNFSFDNFRDGWRVSETLTFGRFFLNSAIISVSSTIGVTISSALVAYSLARTKFNGRKLIFGIMLSTMMIPGQVVMIPQFIIFHRIGWVNTFNPLIIPSFFGAAFFIFLMMQFMKGVPKELDEAAICDGCNKYSVFIRIIFPLLKPALITTAIIQFYWAWDNFLGPLIYLQSSNLFTVSLALRRFADADAGTSFGAMFAMSTLSLIPVFVMFLIFNKHLVEGINTTGIKG